MNSRKLGIKRKKKREFQNKVNCLGLNSVFKLKVLKVIVKIVRENDRKFKLKHNVYECFKKWMNAKKYQINGQFLKFKVSPKKS